MSKETDELIQHRRTVSGKGNPALVRDDICVTPEVDELLRHFFGLGSGTVGDAIIEYLRSSDCSPKTRERIWVELERLDAVMQEKFEQTLKTPDLFEQNTQGDSQPPAKNL